MLINTENEKKLIHNLQIKVENESFKQLISPYLNYCFVIINRVVNNKTESEDVLQETLLKVLININKFRFESSFKTWIAKIAYNQALLTIRDNKSRYNKIIDSSGELIEDRSYNLEETTFKSFEKEVIWEAVDKLSENYKLVLLLFYKDELSVKEISHILSKTENQIKVSLHRARGELKKILAEIV